MGGISYRPYFAPYTRYIVEYDGCGMNVGMDALLWKHCMIQLATGHFKSFQAGIAYQINLLGKNKKRKWKMDYKREGCSASRLHAETTLGYNGFRGYPAK